jgi:hypothetical protein
LIKILSSKKEINEIQKETTIETKISTETKDFTTKIINQISTIIPKNTISRPLAMG